MASEVSKSLGHYLHHAGSLDRMGELDEANGIGDAIIEAAVEAVMARLRGPLAGPDKKTLRGALAEYYRTTSCPPKTERDGWLNGAQYSLPPCGCEIVGNGTGPQPLRIVFCRAHRYVT